MWKFDVAEAEMLGQNFIFKGQPLGHDDKPVPGYSSLHTLSVHIPVITAMMAEEEMTQDEAMYVLLRKQIRSLQESEDPAPYEPRIAENISDFFVGQRITSAIRSTA